MLPTTLRNALLTAAAFLPAQVLADDDDSSDIVTFQFSGCVSTCLGKTGYSMDGEDNQKEMCKASRDGLLEAIIACTVSDCLEELAAVDANLLQPMQTGCKELEKPVSDDEIEDAARAVVNIQATLAATTSTSTTSSDPTTPTLQPLGVEIGTSITPYILTAPVPGETPTAVEPAAEPTTTSPAPIIVAEPTTSRLEPEVPAETQLPPEPVTPAEASSTTAAAAIVPLAQPTDASSEQPPAPEATTIAEPPSDPAPIPLPASASTSTAAADHANHLQPETTQQETTMVKPTSTAEQANTQAQPTTAHAQAPANSPAADATTSAEASRTGDSGSKPTLSDGGGDEGEDEDEDSSPSGTSTATPDISGELVLATGTPTASSSSSSSLSGFATSVTASPSASGTQAAASGDADGGLGGGSPFSVVMASAAAPGVVSYRWWAPLFAMMGIFASSML